jgi:hypothetical protein
VAPIFRSFSYPSNTGVARGEGLMENEDCPAAKADDTMTDITSVETTNKTDLRIIIKPPAVIDIN